MCVISTPSRGLMVTQVEPAAQSERESNSRLGGRRARKVSNRGSSARRVRRFFAARRATPWNARVPQSGLIKMQIIADDPSVGRDQDRNIARVQEKAAEGEFDFLDLC